MTNKAVAYESERTGSFEITETEANVSAGLPVRGSII